MMMNRLTPAAGPLCMVLLLATLTPLGFDPPMARILGPVCLVLMLAALAASRRSGRGPSPVDATFAAYFGLFSAVFWLWPHSVGALAARFPVAMLYGLLLLMAAVPLALGLPCFTEYFARRQAPPEVWQTNIFKNINRRMTAVWVVIFGAATILAAVPGLMDQPPVLAHALCEGAVPALLMLGVGLPFNKWYPTHYQKKIGLPVAPVKPGPAAGLGGIVQRVAPGRKNVAEYKVVAVNGSPHVGIGNTDQMLQMLAQGLASHGVELEQVHLADKHIEYCIGCALCLDKGKCWRNDDDYNEVVGKVLEADGVILASPVYVMNCTGQMKTFLDRSLPYGHKPRTSWKPGLVVSVSAGMWEVRVAEYLSKVLRIFGAYPLGQLTAIAVGPGMFVGKPSIEQRAADLARDLAVAIKEKRSFPPTEMDLFFWRFMGNLVAENKEFMADDFEHWQKNGLYDGFEAYVQQMTSPPLGDAETRSAWMKGVIAEQKKKSKSAK